MCLKKVNIWNCFEYVVRLKILIHFTLWYCANFYYIFNQCYTGL